MKKEEFYELLAEIDENEVKKVKEYSNKKKKFPIKWLSVAAAATAAVIVVSLTMNGYFAGNNAKLNVAEVTTTTIQENTKGAETTTPDVQQAQTTEIENLKRPSLMLPMDDPEFVAVLKNYTIDKDLGNVYFGNIELTDAGKAAIAKDGFTIDRIGSFDEVFEVYESNRYNSMASFITTDSVMHVYHLYFAYLLKNTEKNYLIGQLEEMNAELLSEAEKQYDEFKGTEWERAAYINMGFFSVAAKLLDENAAVRNEVKDVVAEELANIKAEEFVESPLFSGEELVIEDYSQYKPRGYYDSEDNLKRYFKTMMWYGRRNFAYEDKDLTKSAVLMTIALNDKALDTWSKIYTVTSFFAGAADDNGYYEYYPLVAACFGKNPTKEAILNDAAWKNFYKLAKDLKQPEINSVPSYMMDSDEEVAENNYGFRLMGQRFSLDEAIFQQLVYRNVTENSNGERRMLPDVMDVAAALGSEEAMNILEKQGDTDYKNYTENMNKLKERVSNAGDETWDASLYSRWMYTLLPLLDKKGEGYPTFMQSDNWARKNLVTFSGSYAELKHDTILYSKQIIAELGGGPLDAVDDRGYVEPEVELYARLENLIKSTIQGLEGYGYLSAEDKENLQIMETIVVSLKEISEKELRDETLTDEEYEFIKTYGGQIEHLWYKTYEGESDEITAMNFPGSIVADVATDAESGNCLEVGTGRFREIVVAVPVDGKIRLCKGCVYSFYQFESSERLTDSEWRDKLYDYSENESEISPSWVQEILN